jgi:hypothetical protein
VTGDQDSRPAHASRSLISAVAITLLLRGAMKSVTDIGMCVLLILSTACRHTDSPTSPTSTTTTPAAASPTYSEEFGDTLPVSGAAFYSFTVTQYGTVNVSLTSVSGTYVPSTVTLGLGLGKPDGETCATSSSISTQSGAGPQLTGTYDPGVYCVKVSDVGNLFSAARFVVTIAYP